uniref:Uncharacterized protein n=1 Tax=Corynoplastis japonica TaxID=700918 RepID=A0A1X9PVW3_9RHOD|nr:hypothetical protein [Corynoplastis japonica]
MDTQKGKHTRPSNGAWVDCKFRSSFLRNPKSSHYYYLVRSILEFQLGTNISSQIFRDVYEVVVLLYPTSKYRLDFYGLGYARERNINITSLPIVSLTTLKQDSLLTRIEVIKPMIVNKFLCYRPKNKTKISEYKLLEYTPGCLPNYCEVEISEIRSKVLSLIMSVEKVSLTKELMVLLSSDKFHDMILSISMKEDEFKSKYIKHGVSFTNGLLGIDMHTGQLEWHKYNASVYSSTMRGTHELSLDMNIHEIYDHDYTLSVETYSILKSISRNDSTIAGAIRYLLRSALLGGQDARQFHVLLFLFGAAGTGKSQIIQLNVYVKALLKKYQLYLQISLVVCMLVLLLYILVKFILSVQLLVGLYQ